MIFFGRCSDKQDCPKIKDKKREILELMVDAFGVRGPL